jgi:hypothetical protein
VPGLFRDRTTGRRPCRRRHGFLGRERPVEVRRLHGKKKRAWIFADVSRIPSHAYRVDSEEERSSADVAVDRHAKGPCSRRHLVPGFPTQAKRAGVTDEGFGLRRPVAGPRPDLAPDDRGCSRAGIVVTARRSEEGEADQDRNRQPRRPASCHAASMIHSRCADYLIASPSFSHSSTRLTIRIVEPA